MFLCKTTEPINHLLAQSTPYPTPQEIEQERMLFICFLSENAFSYFNNKNVIGMIKLTNGHDSKSAYEERHPAAKNKKE